MEKTDLKRKIEELELEINGQIPEYIKILNEKVVKIRAGNDWEGYKWHIITIDDVAKYIKYESNNIESGCRRIGTLVGDWRPIDRLAKLLWNGIFKKLNPDKECRQVLENA